MSLARPHQPANGVEGSPVALHDNPEGVSFQRVVGTVRRGAPWIALCVALASGAAFAFSKLDTKQFTATASLVFSSSDQVSQQIVGVQPTVTNDSLSQQSTNVELVRLGSTAARTASLLDQGLTKSEVQDSLEISAVSNTDVVNVSATSTSAQLAAAIANTYSNEFVRRQRASNSQQFKTALDVVNRQLAALSPQQRSGQAGRALEDRAQSLAILARINSGGVHVVQEATVPTSPSSPKVARNTIIAAVLGLAIGLGVAFLIERFDRRLRDRDELEESFGLPVVGTVPDTKALSDRWSGVLPPLESEAFRMLRARLRYFEADGKITSVLITSGAARDGKSTVAWNLALTAASVGSKAILLECDFHQPTLATRRGLFRMPGLSELLTGKNDLVVQHVPVTNSSNGQDPGRQLDVVVAGTRPPNPLELMESAEMAALMQHLGNEYDLVVMDTPPITLMSDAIPLLRLVSGVLVVGEPGRTKRGSAAAVREQLDNLGAPVLGVVANRVKHSADFYAYYHDDEMASLPAGERR
jgi:capsular exopolysaccharide synthesis family protein